LVVSVIVPHGASKPMRVTLPKMPWAVQLVEIMPARQMSTSTSSTNAAFENKFSPDAAPRMGVSVLWLRSHLTDTAEQLAPLSLPAAAVQLVSSTTDLNLQLDVAPGGHYSFELRE
jgi:hypothetical protein